MREVQASLFSADPEGRYPASVLAGAALMERRAKTGRGGEGTRSNFEYVLICARTGGMDQERRSKYAG